MNYVLIVVSSILGGLLAGFAFNWYMQDAMEEAFREGEVFEIKKRNKQDGAE